ncbi:hypothetical protein KI811_03710 [Geobacter hydrogenophilus]|uniref:Rhodanese domain-containing protein n=1 Tax=Geobacter hydrogenophilus TaxID=40983 RepID=A0A9W6LE10_9BACT|nr:rhodanese-like domain-containing protein [Geobacter hydrogenophilus]MBT0892927.1 hypothetical protein [Geobacter hydrogenophilus]GLI39239.1 hypothetical protein GHYDROH2_27400 [Geobacter hydrogenophilus]
MRRGLGVTFLLVLMCSALAIADISKIDDVPRISAAQAYSKFMKGDVILVDSMNERTYAKYHVLGAVSLPGDGEDDLNKIRQMAEPVPLGQEIIVYCD